MVEEYISCCFTCFSDYHDSHLHSSTKRWDWIPAVSSRGRFNESGMTIHLSDRLFYVAERFDVVDLLLEVIAAGDFHAVWGASTAVNVTRPLRSLIKSNIRIAWPFSSPDWIRIQLAMPLRSFASKWAAIER